MIAQSLREVLEATGYLENGEPAHGVYLDEDARNKCQAREFVPDALWRSDSALTVYFKFEPEVPSAEQVARWRREIWNQGFAPLLWIISPERIDLYNGFGRPRENGDATKHRLKTFQKIESELDNLDVFAGRLAMETGRFWQQKSAVNRRTSVDRQLLSDLSALERDLIKLEMDRSDAQGLIGRSIFTQYLIDRQIVTQQFLKDNYDHNTLPRILRDPFATEQLFNRLRKIFNGDMFPSESSTESKPEHLCRVADFLEAVDPESGQTTLFPYQFDVIPVELISSIYEQFAHKAPLTSSTNSGTDVFYTRLSLVALVLDEIMEGLTGEETVIDLTCGSGVFLVEALRRLVNLRSNGSKPSRELIRSTLHKQIYGVDISEAAVRVAAFSLYLAALELDPAPHSPQTLNFKSLIGKTLIVRDVWDVESRTNGQATLTKWGTPRKFDVIVGNPPWSYRGQETTAARRTRRGQESERPPRGESLDFVFRAMDFASENTRFGLILSAVQFFSRSRTGVNALRRVMEKLSPVTLVNLSNQSDWLFPNSKMPAVVFFARHRELRRDVITAVQVPWSPVGAKSHTFKIARSDIITLPLSDWQRKPEFLKAAFVGFRRDLALLDRLITRHQTLGNQLLKFGAELRVGLTFGNRSDDSSFLRGLPLLKSKDLQPFSLPEDLVPFEDGKAQRPRNRDIYRAPLLLIKEFIKEKPHPRPVVAVADQDIVFTNSFFGAALPAAKRETAHLLAAILSSSLASWFFLMSASTFGLWMRRITCQDIECMPVPDLSTVLRSKAGSRLTQLVQDLQKNSPSASGWRALDEAVFDLYDLDETDRIVARDGLFRASWQWKAGKDASVEAASISEVSEYARIFQSAVGVWLSAANQRYMRAEVFDLPEQAPLRVVRFVLEDRSELLKPSELEVIEPEGDLRDVLNRIGDRLSAPLANSIVGQRELRVHGRNEVVIIKPAARRHWMGVSALEDADSVIVESFSGTAV